MQLEAAGKKGSLESGVPLSRQGHLLKWCRLRSLVSGWWQYGQHESRLVAGQCFKERHDLVDVDADYILETHTLEEKYKKITN